MSWCSLHNLPDHTLVTQVRPVSSDYLGYIPNISSVWSVFVEGNAFTVDVKNECIHVHPRKI
jgi:hypothetical protein